MSYSVTGIAPAGATTPAIAVVARRGEAFAAAPPVAPIEPTAAAIVATAVIIASAIIVATAVTAVGRAEKYVPQPFEESLRAGITGITHLSYLIIRMGKGFPPCPIFHNIPNGVKGLLGNSVYP